MRRCRRGLLAAAAVIEDQLQSQGVRYRVALVTPTYRPGELWSPLQIAGALKCLREWARRKGIWVRYVWRFEFGALNGRPHYHVMVWLPRGHTMPLWDRQGWWGHGMTNAVWARRPVGYLAKYTAKPTTGLTRCETSTSVGDVSGARWWGVSGLGVEGRRRFRWRVAPRWVQERSEEGDDVRRLPDGWWRIGAWEMRSPWEYQGGDDYGRVRIRWRGWDQWDIALAA